MSAHGFSPYRHALELLASATARRAAEPECSVTVARNYKHDITFEVVVRGPSVTECNLMAQYEVDLLTAKYPAGGAVSPQDDPPAQVEVAVPLAPIKAARRRVVAQ